LRLDVEFHISPDDAHLPELYRRAHAVVLPAVCRSEAFGLTLVEGMAAGCVPIASNLPGVREVIGRTGFVYPKGDAPCLAGIVRGLRDCPGLVEAIGKVARTRAAAYDRDEMMSEYERLLDGLVACRDLKIALTEGAKSPASALRVFGRELRRVLQADAIEMVLGANPAQTHAAAAAGVAGVPDHREFRQALTLVEWYGMCTAGSGLVDPHGGPLHLNDVVRASVPAAMVAPMTIGGERFGVLLAIREQPFSQDDLAKLTCYARYVAPSVHKVCGEKMITRSGVAVRRPSTGRQLTVMDRFERSTGDPRSLVASGAHTIAQPELCR
jgi:Glycosyl transferases group 1